MMEIEGVTGWRKGNLRERNRTEQEINREKREYNGTEKSAVFKIGEGNRTEDARNRQMCERNRPRH